MTKKITCLYCSKQFEGKSLKATYCSNSCKSYAYRERKGTIPSTIQEIEPITTNSSILKPDKNGMEFLRQSLMMSFSTEHLTNSMFRDAEVEQDLETVKIHGNGFIISSFDDEEIKKFITNFDGTPLFLGATKSPYYTDNTGNVNIIYKTFVSLKTALEKCNVPKEVLYSTGDA